MAKGSIMLGYMILFIYVVGSGNLNRYMNMRYAFITYFGIVALSLLTVIQFKQLNGKQNHNPLQEGSIHSHVLDHDHIHHHDHSHRSGLYKFQHAILALPIATGLLFPVATLNSNLVSNKGIQFPVINGGSNWDKWNQILKPDTSPFFPKEQYQQMMDVHLQNALQQNSLVLNDSNYLSQMEIIYKDNEQLIGKTVEFSGFVFHDKSLPDNRVFLLRFGMVHCIVDSGVYGLLVELPANENLNNDDWYTMKGTLSKTYNEQIGGMIPYVKVDSLTQINTPQEPYVYLHYS